MQNCLRWFGLVSHRHSQSASRLTCSCLSPLCCAGTWALVSCFASVFGQWPAAMHLVSAPPTLRLACFASIACAVCPSAPQGLPQNRAPWLFIRIPTSAKDLEFKTHCCRPRQAADGLPNSLPVKSRSWRTSTCPLRPSAIPDSLPGSRHSGLARQADTINS